MTTIFQRGSTPRPGQPITSRSFSDLSSASTGARGQMINGMTTGLQGSGGLILVPNIPIPALANIIHTPFEIFATQNIAGGTWDGTYNISLWPGTLNQLLFTNNLLPGDPINQAITANQYVVLTCQSDGYAVTSYTWGLQPAPFTPPDATIDTPPSTFYILIGFIAYNAVPNTITGYQIVFDDLTASPQEWTRTTRPSAGPYDLAYEIYYYWNISA